MKGLYGRIETEVRTGMSRVGKIERWQG